MEMTNNTFATRALNSDAFGAAAFLTAFFSLVGTALGMLVLAIDGLWFASAVVLVLGSAFAGGLVRIRFC